MFKFQEHRNNIHREEYIAENLTIEGKTRYMG